MAQIVASISTQMVHDFRLQANESYEEMQFADNVMRLVSVLLRIEDLLKDANKNERDLSMIRCLAYRIEDVLETCFVEVPFVFHKYDELCIKRLVRRCFGVLSDGKTFKNIWDMISGIEPEIQSFCEVFPNDVPDGSTCNGEETRVIHRSVRWPRQIYPRGVEEHFVGVATELEELVSLVVDNEQHCVISICGVKGLGKTTLARKIYNDPRVRHRFKAFAWVTLSQDCQVDILCQNILRQLGTGRVTIAERQMVIDQLMEIQRQKICLIVIDSIWEINQWEQISSAFQMEGTGTRLLLTTREENIANVGFPVQLRLLNDVEGWELLKKHAFPGKNAPDFGMLPKLGKEMVRKCGYLPLAISNLGRILSRKISLSDWEMVNDDVDRYLQTDYQNEADGRFFDSLDSSYDNLPYHLKQCFLYLGIFREDKDIDSEDLIFLWMAEGMVSSVGQENEGTIMETAEHYLRELAFSGLLQVQVDELSTSRRFELFCLHNRVRGLSLYQGDKEDFRLKVVDFSDGKQPTSDPFTLSDGTRRLVIHFNKEVNLWEHNFVGIDHLRSLLLINSEKKYVHIPVRISDFMEFKLLRVLHFVRCKFEGRKLPKGIDKLVNLRYLGLLYCDLDELPSSIGNMRNLHVLNVRTSGYDQMTIPNVLCQIIRLKHLRIPDYSDREQIKKLEFSGLLELETLVGFNSLIHDIDCLPNLMKLRHLVIHAYSNDSLTSIIRYIMFNGARMQTSLFIENKCNFTSPEGLAILEEVLMCPNLRALTLSMVLIRKFPDCRMHASSDITQLKLIGCKLKEDPMEALGKFRNLRKLCLGYGAFVGREMAVHHRGFQNLEYIEFHSLPNLEEWRMHEGAMSNLSALKVRRCPKLLKIPDGLTSIYSLKNMDIELAPSALEEDREAEYRRKFEFVNSFIIRKLDPFADQ